VKRQLVHFPPRRLAGFPKLHFTLGLAKSRYFGWAVRVGFVARGLVYALMGGVTVALSLGVVERGTEPNQQGALSLVAANPLGRVVIAMAAVGLGAYALWKLVLAGVGVGPEGGSHHRAFDRVANLAGALVYIAFCALVLRVLFGSAGNQAREQHDTAAGVLHWPAGPGVVGAAGVILVAICVYQAWIAIRGQFADDCKTGNMGVAEHHSFMWLGRLGLFSRAFVFGISGYFLLRTALDDKVSRGIGVDGALAEVHGQPLGNVLLFLTGAGLLVFAVYSLLEGRHRRL
jgi:hypothetical protein